MNGEAVAVEDALQSVGRVLADIRSEFRGVEAIGEQLNQRDVVLGKQLRDITSRVGDSHARLGDLLQRLSPTPPPSPIAILIKALACMIVAKGRGGPEMLEAIAKEKYPGDRRVREAVDFLTTRAAVSPAHTSVVGWAAELTQVLNYPGLIAMLAMPSAYAALAPRGLRLDLSAGALRLPGRSVAPTASGSFVGEGQPIPVRRLSLQTTIIEPYKMGVISTFSRELANHSTPSIEAVLREAIAEDTWLTVDTALLDSNAQVTDVRPAGLLFGITPIAAAAGGGQTALVADMNALATAVPFATDLVYLSDQATRVRALTLAPGGGLPLIPWVTSPVIPPTRLLAVDASDLATAEGDTPAFDVSQQTVLHESDAPLPIVDGSQVIASPVRSTWQTAVLALRLLQDMSWSLTRSGRIAFIDAITW